MGSKIVQAIFYITAIFIFRGKTQDDGIVISLRGKEIPNHGLVTTQDIGVDPNGTQLEFGLSCSTTSDMCCTDHPVSRTPINNRPSGNGSWLYPHQLNYRYVYRQIDRPYYTFGIRRNGGAVYLFRNHLNQNYLELSTTDGIWRCTIPDSNGGEQTKYIGIYSNETNNGSLSVGTPGSIQFSIVSEDPVVFNLTFYTTGGPATYVTWTRDGVNISLTRDGHYKTLQTVLKNQERSYKDGDYSNTLTVSGRLPGVYAVSVSNDRTNVPVKSEDVSVIDVSDSSIPINVTQSPDLTDINVSWRLDESISKQQTELYEVWYMVCPMVQGECITTSATVNITDTHYSIPNVLQYATYSFTITPQSNQSAVYILPGSHTIRTKGILAPEIYSVTELANVTTVQVTWRQPEGGLVADEYVMSYTRLTGRDGQCSSFQDTLNNVIVKAEGEAMTYATSIHVYANSVYSVNITAFSGALYNTSIPFYFETVSSVPSKGPQNLTIVNATSTNTTILWDSVECIHRNGMITQYLLILRPADAFDSRNEEFVLIKSNGLDSGGSYTAIANLPSVSYVFKVAAINRNGIGPFTELHVHVQTLEVTTTTHTEEKSSVNTCTLNAVVPGMAAIIAILLILIIVIITSGTIIQISICKKRMKSKGNEREEDRDTVNTAQEVIYEEPSLPPLLQLQTCPAYRVPNRNNNRAYIIKNYDTNT